MSGSCFRFKRNMPFVAGVSGAGVPWQAQASQAQVQQGVPTPCKPVVSRRAERPQAEVAVEARVGLTNRPPSLFGWQVSSNAPAISSLSRGNPHVAPNCLEDAELSASSPKGWLKPKKLLTYQAASRLSSWVLKRIALIFQGNAHGDGFAFPIHP